MDFFLTEKQHQLKEKAARFTKEEIIPVAAKYDKGDTFPIDVLKKAHELGFITATIPSEYGGEGLGILDNCIITEELAFGCMGIASTIGITSSAVDPIIIAGTEEQKKKFLTPLCRELRLGSLCITEPEAGSDVASVKTKAKKVDGGYIINGRKSFVSCGAYSSFHTVFAAIGKKGFTPSDEAQGFNFFVIPASSVSIGKREDKMGQRASHMAELIFEDVFAPEDNLIGEEEKGYELAMLTLDRGRPLVAASAVGVGRAALEHAIAFVKGHYGETIKKNQAIQFMIADMAKDLEAARMLTWKAAWLTDQGIKNSKEAAIAKVFAADMAMKITLDAVQILGDYGYLRDEMVEKLMRDAKGTQIQEGTNQIQRILIAKELLL